jgi:hypothetical protein
VAVNNKPKLYNTGTSRGILTLDIPTILFV